MTWDKPHLYLRKTSPMISSFSMSKSSSAFLSVRGSSRSPAFRLLIASILYKQVTQPHNMNGGRNTINTPSCERSITGGTKTTNPGRLSNTVTSVSDPDPEPDSGVFSIRIQGLKKRSKMLNNHDKFYFLVTFTTFFL